MSQLAVHQSAGSILGAYLPICLFVYSQRPLHQHITCGEMGKMGLALTQSVRTENAPFLSANTFPLGWGSIIAHVLCERANVIIRVFVNIRGSQYVAFIKLKYRCPSTIGNSIEFHKWLEILILPHCPIIYITYLIVTFLWLLLKIGSRCLFVFLGSTFNALPPSPLLTITSKSLFYRRLSLYPDFFINFLLFYAKNMKSWKFARHRFSAVNFNNREILRQLTI